MSRLQLQVNRPHPSDNTLLFLFLVGGVTPSELRLIKETVATHKPGTQVSQEAFTTKDCLFFCIVMVAFACWLKSLEFPFKYNVELFGLYFNISSF